MSTIIRSLGGLKEHKKNSNSTTGQILTLKLYRVCEVIYIPSMAQILRIKNSRSQYVDLRSPRTIIFRRTFASHDGGLRPISSSPLPKTIVIVRWRVGLFTGLSAWEFFSQLCLIAVISNRIARVQAAAEGIFPGRVWEWAASVNLLSWALEARRNR